MNIKTLLSIACLLPFSLAFASNAMENENQPTAVTLLKSTQSWDGTLYKAYPEGQPELSILKITIPANSALKWHQHPIPNAVYVLSGELTVELEGGEKSIRIKAGDTLAEVVDIIHRGKSGNTPVELVVFYAGAAGTPLSH
ncbi:cupin domain-containing protein [Pseudomonas cichorii]|nr:cupin domain-containing protein [Pseudomonas cichorii]MBX8494181.1 cupin domain-containing protein [Pseudomonas cichorii]MBX8516227.1 cupin domain-containing protein [Pseudomonas cichorii]MBX8532949.1 cupin domain-containing protein [Pseudomonas cichorii]